MAKSKTDHCVMRNGHPFCMNCGETYVINLPAPVHVVTGAIEGFVKTHRHCKKTWQEPKPDMSQEASLRAIWWLEHGERGVSSETIFANLVNMAGELSRVMYKKRPSPQWSHPLDPDDFRRCHLLLEVVPELREEMHRMKAVSPVWSALVDNWEKLTEMLKEQMETGKPNGMYEFMKELGC
jgi:hypothetical protein